MILQNNVPVMMGYDRVHVRAEDILSELLMLTSKSDAAFQSSCSSEEKAPEPEGEDASLEDAAKGEREYVERRLRDDLGREPSEEEVDEWLRRHTEGY
jgi:hypothetical protein